MDPIATAKQFFDKYYPREHIFLAAGLCLALVVVLLLFSDENSEPASGATRLEVATSAATNDSSPANITNPLQLTSPSANDAAAQAPAASASALDIGFGQPAVLLQPEIPASDNIVDASWQNIEIRSGDNLSDIFTKVGLSSQDLFRVLNSSDEAKILDRVYPGYQLDFQIPESGELEQLRVLKSPLEGFLFTRNADDFAVETIKNIPDVQPAFKVGTITDSLFLAGQREQIPAVHIMEMANVFGGVIDFILDPRAGDQFSILYEEEYLNGEFIGYGDILATQFVNQGKRYTAVRYIDEAGEVGYYNPEGESMRKAFLRNPLDVFRISSNFNPRRRHPILNTIRAHKGTDYAAPTGTPIRAASDGQVTWSQRNGSFGNLVVVKHSGGFETKYAHLSRYARGIKKGARVRQGQIIGYVGSTGSATGPHLHYEFLMNGVHQNPRTILDKLPKAESLGAAEMDRFKSQTREILNQFSSLGELRLLTQGQPGAD